jgi:hypothetical protein
MMGNCPQALNFNWLIFLKLHQLIRNQGRNTITRCIEDLV